MLGIVAALEIWLVMTKIQEHIRFRLVFSKIKLNPELVKVSDDKAVLTLHNNTLIPSDSGGAEHKH